MSEPAVEVAPAGQHGQQTQAGSNSGNGQQQPQAGSNGSSGQQQAETDVTTQGNMPATKHQEQVLRDHPATEQRQTSAQAEGAMPSSPHQRQVLRGQQPGEQAGGQHMAGNDAQNRSQNQEPGILRQASVIAHPIQADNGVIYPIDAVLVPQKILSQLEDQGGQNQGAAPQNKPGQKSQQQGQADGQAKAKEAKNG